MGNLVPHAMPMVVASSKANFGQAACRTRIGDNCNGCWFGCTPKLGVLQGMAAVLGLSS